MQGQAQSQILQGGSVVLKMTEQPLTSVGKINAGNNSKNANHQNYNVPMTINYQIHNYITLTHDRRGQHCVTILLYVVVQA